MVLLTAREHFICHWLLVKRYNQNTNERKKMLFAFHKMCFSDPNGSGERMNNSKTFEKYRKEFSSQIKKQNSKYIGDKNSQFGKHWYTNRDTGECKTFSESPNEKWVEGRNIFNGEYSIIATKHTVKNNKLIEEKIKLLWEECKKFKNVVEFCKYKKLCNSTICAYFRTYIVDYKK